MYSPFNRTGRARSSHSMTSDIPRLGQIGRAPEGGAPEFRDRYRLALCSSLGDKCADVVAETRGHLGRPIAGVGRNDIEGPPIHSIEAEPRHSSVSRRNARGPPPPRSPATPSCGHGSLGSVAAGAADRLTTLPDLRALSPGRMPAVIKLSSEPVSKTISAPLLAKAFGAIGAVGQQIEEFLAGQIVRKRAEPHFETRLGSVGRGNLQPFRIPSGYANRVAMQVIVDDLHLPFHDVVGQMVRAW